MGDSWESWIQGVAGNYINTRTEAKYKAPVELQKMQIQAYGPFGQPYLEGVAGQQGQQIAGIPSGWLLIGGIALLVVLASN